jgi:hypothetical protein
MSSSPNRTEKPAKNRQKDASGQPMESALGPFLWLLIPIVAIIVYGLLND